MIRLITKIVKIAWEYRVSTNRENWENTGNSEIIPFFPSHCLFPYNIVYSIPFTSSIMIVECISEYALPSKMAFLPSMQVSWNHFYKDIRLTSQWYHSWLTISKMYSLHYAAEDKTCLTLPSHGQVAVERGFNVNRGISWESPLGVIGHSSVHA